ncbi:MAG: hypothetical protein M3R48_08330 [Candidatus Dormibacteraeota bacterium]|nr:hypothetical protein [Candidatus Dormibacteraeota bacterium]
MKRRQRDSGLRDAFVGVLMTVGPFFGVRYQPPHIEIAVAATPAGDDLDPATAERPLGYDGGAYPQAGADDPEDGVQV